MYTLTHTHTQAHTHAHTHVHTHKYEECTGTSLHGSACRSSGSVEAVVVEAKGKVL